MRILKKMIKWSLINIFSIFYKSMNKITPFIFDQVFNRVIEINEPDTNITNTFRHVGPRSLNIAKYHCKVEKNTIEWINSFQDKSKLLDIGAHMGIFSIYAASVKSCDVVAVEPSFANFSLLNLNIYDNKLNDKITAFCVAISNRETLDQLYMDNISVDLTGGQNEKPIDGGGDPFVPTFNQGIMLMTLNSFQDIFGPFKYLKVDIDGFEKELLEGADRLLGSQHLTSILIEMNENSDDYNNCVKIIESFNFILDEELTSRSHVSTKRGRKIYNHIYYRV